MWANVGISRTQLPAALRHLSLNQRDVLPTVNERQLIFHGAPYFNPQKHL